MLDFPLLHFWCFLRVSKSWLCSTSSLLQFHLFYQTELFAAMFFDPCFLQVWRAEDRLVWTHITNSNLCWRYFQYPFSYPPSNQVYYVTHMFCIYTVCVYNCVYTSFSTPNLISCSCWSTQVFILIVGCIPRSSKRAPARTWGGVRTAYRLYEIFTTEIRKMCKMDQPGVIDTINT